MPKKNYSKNTTTEPRLSEAESRALEEIRAAGQGGIAIRDLPHPEGVSLKICNRLFEKRLIHVSDDAGGEVDTDIHVSDTVRLAEQDEPAPEEPTPPADKLPEKDKGDGSNGTPEPEPPRWRMLPVALGIDEKLALGSEIASLLEQVEALEDEKKASASSFKEQIDCIAAKVAEAGRQLRRGTVDRKIEITEEDDITLAERIVRRVDTGEVISRRTLTGYELAEARQLKLMPPLPAPGAEVRS